MNWKRTPKEYGGGYAALIDVIHQLPCLVCTLHSTDSGKDILLTIGLSRYQNLIRQYTWRDHYANSTADLPGDLQDSEVGARMHVDHCIEALRLIWILRRRLGLVLILVRIIAVENLIP